MIGANHPPVVYVEWRDALTATDGWTGSDDVQKFSREAWSNPLAAAGFLIVDSSEYIVVAVAWNPHIEDVNGAMMIPRSEITRLVQVRPAKGMEKAA